jgi:TolA-binding protein
VIYDIGDYAVKRAQAERLMAVAEAGERVNSHDPRAKYYRAVGLILKKEKAEESERLLREYLKVAPTRTAFPKPVVVHVWLGRLFEHENKPEEAMKEFETAVKVDPKNKMAQEEWKRARKIKG